MKCAARKAGAVISCPVCCQRLQVPGAAVRAIVPAVNPFAGLERLPGRPEPRFNRTVPSVRMVAQDMITPAVITLVLYFTLYLPGVIANWLYLGRADRIKEAIGRYPAGSFFLAVLFIIFAALPIGLISGLLIGFLVQKPA
jgi:hypothetical protein